MLLLQVEEFFKTFTFCFNNNYFYFISFISILVILPYLTKIIQFITFYINSFNNPQYTIYHKYFDPFLLIIFFTILNFNIDILKM